uniref:Immunoglobulin domain-containing protein n=1 Tax=Denticeps clupeoides TaxID=299321 RepID=A0AAY4A3D1_9TELE
TSECLNKSSHSYLICHICIFGVKVTPVIGYEGGEVNIRCPYEDAYEKYIKYLCRGKCDYLNPDIVIKTGHGQTSAAEGRFSLYDNTTAGSFTVTITRLTAQDSGKYWCGPDIYTELQLRVKKVVNVSGCEGHSVSITCNYERSCRDQHEKYFCRGNKTSSCIATGPKASTSVKERGRFSLEDDPAAKFFNVRIGELRAEDTGIYWCVEWCGELHLDVKRGEN